jgi:hypothetical protein
MNQLHYNKGEKMGGSTYIPEPNNKQYEIDELIGIKISLINALEQLDLLIDSMTECDCEDGCCK